MSTKELYAKINQILKAKEVEFSRRNKFYLPTLETERNRSKKKPTSKCKII